jgi:hypothetical protein
MLLIYPPAARSSEAPLGIARLSAFLKARGREARLLDLNQEALEYLLALEPPPGLVAGSSGAAGLWTKGALKRRPAALAALREPGTYRLPPDGQPASRYDRAVLDLNRALKALSAPYGAEAGLANYAETGRSPLRGADLLAAASSFEDSVYYPLFSRRIDEELSALADYASDTGLQPTVGLSLNYLSQALPAFAMLGYLKRRHPRTRRVLGGALISSWIAQGALRADERFGGLADELIPGRGEDALARLFGLEGERPPSLSAGGASARSAQRAAQAECPDFDGLMDLVYLAPRRILPYAFSSGCPWRRCSFCPETAEAADYVGLNARRAMEQLASLAARYKPDLLHFCDNEISPLYLRALAEGGPGANWYGFARFSPALLDRNFCAALAASGCVMLQLGLESGDQAVLDALNKGTRLKDIDVILGNLAAAGIGSYLYVLFGTPSEDEAAAARTARYLRDRAELVAFLNVAVFNLPVSGTEARALGARAFYEGELSLYAEFAHPLGWNRDRVRSFIRKELEAVPAIRSMLKRTPRVFSSNHAPFFLEATRGSAIHFPRYRT